MKKNKILLGLFFVAIIAFNVSISINKVGGDISFSNIITNMNASAEESYDYADQGCYTCAQLGTAVFFVSGVQEVVLGRTDV